MSSSKASTRIALLILTALSIFGLTACPVNFNPPQRQIEGVYDAETRYDMKTLAGTLSTVKSWEQPRVAIKDAIIRTIKRLYNNDIALLVAEYYGDSIAADIEAYLVELSPAWLRNLTGTLSIVDAQLDMVDVQTSILLASDPDNPSALKATQLWNGITVFRDPLCRKNGGLNCPQITVSIQELLDAEYPIDLVNSTFAATEEVENQLSLTSNEIRFNYGRLALYLMTNLALPDEPGASLQLRDVIMAAINCRGLAGRLAGEDKVLGWNIAGFEVGVSLNDLIGSCEDGIFAMVNDFVDQFSVPITMNLGGQITALDNNLDGVVDQLVSSALQGQVKASLLSGQSKEGPVSGQMTSWRVGDLQNDGLNTTDGTSDQVDDGVPLWESDNSNP